MAAQKTTLTVMVDYRDNYRAWQEAVIEEFLKEHPDIAIDTWMPTGSIPQNILVRIAGGTPPDLVFHDPYTVIDFARQDLALDLAPYVDRDSEQFSGWLPSATDLFRFRGGLYGLPQDLQIGAIFYNVDAFNAAGVTTPDSNWTYDDLRDYARSLISIDGQGHITRHGFRIPTWRNWLSVIWAHGGDFLDSWTDPTEFVGNSEGVMAGLEYFRNLVDIQAVQDQQTHASMGLATAFRQQHIAIGQTNTVSLHSYRDIEDFTWDVASLPTGPAGHVAFLNARGWFIPSNSSHKEEAWQLLKYFTSPKGLSMLVEFVGGVPADREAVLNEWLPSLDMPQNRHLLTLGVEAARAPGALAATVYDPIGIESHHVIWGEKGTAAALEHMEQQVMQAIKELVD